MRCLTDIEVQAVVDGEASKEIQAHADSCEACRTRVRERRSQMETIASLIDADGMPSSALESRLRHAMRDLGEIPARPREAHRERLARDFVSPLHSPSPAVRVAHRHARLRSGQMLFDESERRFRCERGTSGPVCQIECLDPARIAPQAMTDAEERTRARAAHLVPGAHTPEETVIMRTHAERGAYMLAQSRLPLIRLASEIAATHHENWDGSGYPNNLAATQIPVGGRITALADVFDALGSKRCYKEAWERDRVIEFILAERGRKFEPRLVDILIGKLDKAEAVRRMLPD